jgi:polar amino acid transport system substrate-binding protein
MRCALLSLIANLFACPGKAAEQVLAPSGTLRAAYIGPNVAQARLDPATGTISGMIADIARELGRRADVPVNITPLPTAAAVLDAIRSRQVDIGFVAPNPDVHAGAAERACTCRFPAPVREGTRPTRSGDRGEYR